ncbi:hypothetical protein CPB84DRAFT_1632420, partial [Gymnopilus junonius]
SMRDTLLHKMEYILSGQVKYVDTESEGINNIFGALHASWYPRFAKNGYGAPSTADPSTLQRDGRRPVNTSLNVPRLSKEIKDNQEVYQMLLDALCPVFEWIYATLKRLFPDTFLSLSISVQFLPNSTTSPVYPFAGFVLNVNVSTRMHRDTGDKDICLVLIISDCVGGELVLV